MNELQINCEINILTACNIKFLLSSLLVCEVIDIL